MGSRGKKSKRGGNERHSRQERLKEGEKKRMERWREEKRERASEEGKTTGSECSKIELVDYSFIRPGQASPWILQADLALLFSAPRSHHTLGVKRGLFALSNTQGTQGQRDKGTTPKKITKPEFCARGSI